MTDGEPTTTLADVPALISLDAALDAAARVVHVCPTCHAADGALIPLFLEIVGPVVFALPDGTEAARVVGPYRACQRCGWTSSRHRDISKWSEDR